MCLRHPGPGPAPPGAPPVWEALQPGGREGSGQARGRSWGPAGATPTGRSGRQASPSPLFPRVASATERGRARVWPPRARAAWKATQQASGGRAGGQPPPSGSGRGQAGRPEGFRPFQKAPPSSGASPTPCWGFLASASGHPHPVSCFPAPSGKGQPRCGTRWGPLRGALPWVRGPQASSGVRWPPSSRRQDPSPQRGPHAVLGAAGPAWLVGVRGLQPLLPSTLSLRRPECTRGSQSHFGGTRCVPPEDHSGRGTPSPARAVGGAGLGVGGAQRGAGGDRGPQGPPPEGGPVWSRVPG